MLAYGVHGRFAGVVLDRIEIASKAGKVLWWSNDERRRRLSVRIAGRDNNIVLAV
jgi:hypothetical protein